MIKFRFYITFRHTFAVVTKVTTMLFDVVLTHFDFVSSFFLSFCFSFFKKTKPLQDKTKNAKVEKAVNIVLYLLLYRKASLYQQRSAYN